MAVAIIAIIFGSFLLLMKMLLNQKSENALPQNIQEGSSMALSELEEMIASTINQAVEPLVARLDELESSHLLATSEKLLLNDAEDVSEKQATRIRSES